MSIMIFILIIESFLFFFINQFFELDSITFQITSTIIIVVNSFLYLFAVRKYADNKEEYFILIGCYFVRIFVLYFDFYGRDLFILPNSGLDSEMYHLNAINFSNGLDEGRGGYYSIFLGYAYYLFGDQRILAQYINILFGVFTIIIINKLFKMIGMNRKNSFKLLLIISFLPNLIIMNSILLRESIIIFLISFSLYSFVKWWNTNNLLNLSIAMILPILASLFHSGSISIICGYMLVLIFYNRTKSRYEVNLKSVVYGALFFLSFYVASNYYNEILFAKFGSLSSINDITERAEIYTSGGSAYLQNLQADNIFTLIFYTPIRMLYFVASPLPWDWRGFQDIFAFMFSGLFYISTLIYAIKALNVRNNENKNLLIGLLLMALITTLFFSWGVSNSGTALRHREKFISIYSVLLAVSWISLKTKIEKKESIYKRKRNRQNLI